MLAFWLRRPCSSLIAKGRDERGRQEPFNSLDLSRGLFCWLWFISGGFVVLGCGGDLGWFGYLCAL